jgi:hypothetical protein
VRACVSVCLHPYLSVSEGLCACETASERAGPSVCCACASTCVCVCGSVYGGEGVGVFICVRTRVSVRARVSVHACLLRLSMCVGSCVSIGLHLRACVFDVCVCVCSERVCAPRRCAHSRGTAATCGIYSSACAALCGRARVVAARCHWPGSRAFGRRCHLEEPHGQRTMGWPVFPHVRDRRRRRHLRHWRHQHGRRHRLHLLQGRVGEHRRRCVAGLGPGVAWSGGYHWGPRGALRGGVRGGYEGVLQGHQGAPRGYLEGTSAALRGYLEGTQGVLRGIRVVLLGTQGYSGGTRGLVLGYLRGTQEALMGHLEVYGGT